MTRLEADRSFHEDSLRHSQDAAVAEWRRPPLIGDTHLLLSLTLSGDYADPQRRYLLGLDATRH